MPIVNRVAELMPEISEWRRDIHANPELLYDVHRTAASVADKLRAFGCDEVATGLGRTGVVGLIRAGPNEASRRPSEGAEGALCRYSTASRICTRRSPPGGMTCTPIPS